MRGDKNTASIGAGGWVRDVFIAGAGQTPVTKDPRRRGRYLGAAAVQAALADAGIAARRSARCSSATCCPAFSRNQQQLGGLIADYSGLAGVEAVTIEAACASGGAAARMAYLAVAGGIHDVVAVCGVERMTHVERNTVTRALATAADWELEGVCGESFLSLNAALMRAYMDKYGVAAERFAPFSINAHRNAQSNPNALLHKSLDLDTYRASRLVADPIRLFDVSPICNGAAALVFVAPHLATKAHARIRIAGSALATAPLALSRRADPLQLTAVESSTQRALRQAGVAHADLDLFEPHDAYTIMTALTLEAAGFAAPGTGLDWAHEERIGLAGDLPLTTFGGLKARGHPVGASGCYQLVEAFLQLAGRAGENQVPDAAVALVQNIGGTGATVATHVLIRDA